MESQGSPQKALAGPGRAEGLGNRRCSCRDAADLRQYIVYHMSASLLAQRRGHAPLASSVSGVLVVSQQETVTQVGAAARAGEGAVTEEEKSKLIITNTYSFLETLIISSTSFFFSLSVRTFHVHFFASLRVNCTLPDHVFSRQVIASTRRRQRSRREAPPDRGAEAPEPYFLGYVCIP